MAGGRGGQDIGTKMTLSKNILPLSTRHQHPDPPSDKTWDVRAAGSVTSLALQQHKSHDKECSLRTKRNDISNADTENYSSLVRICVGVCLCSKRAGMLIQYPVFGINTIYKTFSSAVGFETQLLYPNNHHETFFETSIFVSSQE